MKTPKTDKVLSECHQRTTDVDFSDLFKMYQHAQKLEELLIEVASSKYIDGVGWPEIDAFHPDNTENRRPIEGQ